jgi:hypothetical protein
MDMSEVQAATNERDATDAEIMLSAAASCLSPDQHDVFLTLNDGDTLARLCRSVQKRLPKPTLESASD